MESYCRSVCITLILLLLFVFSLDASVVIVSGGMQVIYDKSPRLKIRGTGFESISESQIKLDLSINGESTNSLETGVDYMITKDGTAGLILKLNSNKS